MSKPHGERAHSKFSASGAERWLNCPGSVALAEGLPDKSSPWAEEGTRAHELLETNLRAAIAEGRSRSPVIWGKHPHEMKRHVTNSANFILGLHARIRGAELQVETRVYLKFIHEEMFGTLDSAILDHFGTLHIFDFKYGAGHAVSPKKNLQMIFYGIGVAHAHHWNFKRVRLWIVQPRIKGYDGPTFWDVPIFELREYVRVFEEGVERVEATPDLYRAGSWCHWCKAKGVCPLKKENKLDKAREIFNTNERQDHGEKENQDYEPDEENFEAKAGDREDYF